MQLMPGTAQLISRQFSEQIDAAQLGDPALNIDYGQAYLEQLRDSPLTGGLLPKVIAAYNAGPGSLKKWADKGRDSVDPLLFIESIPYWETRHYVEQVLRNYWAYERNAGRSSASLEAIAQGLWPRFPGQPGASAVRLDAAPAAIRAANAD
jgi:soluble lytic murein transglycosylase-like protein